MQWLLVHGELPTHPQAALLEAAMLGCVDHGPHAPSIAAARVAVTCGVAMNGALAQSAGVLGDIHGGAIQQAMELYAGIAGQLGPDSTLDDIADLVDRFARDYGGFVPGFGHRFHSNDPRTPRLLALAEHARAEGVIGGRFMDLAQRVAAAIEHRRGRRIPMNIDGAAAAVYLELGFAPPLGRGLLVLARLMGAMAHAWEQMCQGGRIKGPVPKDIGYRYDGPAPRAFPAS